MIIIKTKDGAITNVSNDAGEVFEAGVHYQVVDETPAKPAIDSQEAEVATAAAADEQVSEDEIQAEEEAKAQADAQAADEAKAAEEAQAAEAAKTEAEASAGAQAEVEAANPSEQLG